MSTKMQQNQIIEWRYRAAKQRWTGTRTIYDNKRKYTDTDTCTNLDDYSKGLVNV